MQNRPVGRTSDKPPAKPTARLVPIENFERSAEISRTLERRRRRQTLVCLRSQQRFAALDIEIDISAQNYANAIATTHFAALQVFCNFVSALLATMEQFATISHLEFSQQQTTLNLCLERKLFLASNLFFHGSFMILELA